MGFTRVLTKPGWARIRGALVKLTELQMGCPFPASAPDSTPINSQNAAARILGPKLSKKSAYLMPQIKPQIPGMKPFHRRPARKTKTKQGDVVRQGCASTLQKKLPL